MCYESQDVVRISGCKMRLKSATYVAFELFKVGVAVDALCRVDLRPAKVSEERGE